MERRLSAPDGADNPELTIAPYSTPPLASIALLAALALAYEVLLTRLFAIIQWHHFSFMIISLALLGYGASGSFLALAGVRLATRFAGIYVANALLFSVSAAVAFLLAQLLPFNPLEIAWNRVQLFYLLILYIMLAIPFFCVANAIGLTLLRYPNHIHRIYGYDLAGAGGGALLIVLVFLVASPMTALWLLCSCALAATVLAAFECRWRPLGVALFAASVIAASLLAPAGWYALRFSEYKGLSQTLNAVGAERIAEVSSPLGLITVVRNRQAPLRYAPGLSLAATTSPPEQLALFSDGEPLGALTRFRGQRDALQYLDYLTSALPYHLLNRPHVLVLGAGAGGDVLQGVYHRASLVDAVELNKQIVELMRADFADFTGDLYRREDVRVHIAEARGFIAANANRYDLIQIPLLDAFSATSAGLYALSESYLYTVEAFVDYLNHLEAGGILAVTRWLNLPPKDALKLFATAEQALARLGLSEPHRRLALIRGWKTTTLLVKNGLFSDSEIAAIRAFCAQRSFDTAYFPGMEPGMANRYNRLDRPYLFQGASAILGPQPEDFFRNYKFDIRPATDDRPFFFNFFKWRTFPELLSLTAGGGFAQLEWGYLILVATLAQALIASVGLILLPLRLSGTQNATRHSRGDYRRIWIYFTAIGIGFLFLEIAFIQKFILFLSHPFYAVAVVLSAFLVFAGLGSRCSSAWEQHRNPYTAWFCAAAIAVFAVSYLLLLPSLVHSTALAWPTPIKILLTIVLIAPLAFAMGTLFPLGLSRVSQSTPKLVPWAWAINGCASVISAALATILAMQIGFSGVVLTAAALYLLAAGSVPRRSEI